MKPLRSSVIAIVLSAALLLSARAGAYEPVQPKDVDAGMPYDIAEVPVKDPQSLQGVRVAIVRYTNYVRIQRACELLKETDDSVETILEKVGFNNVNHFYKTFRKVTGQKPSEFRRQRGV